jgi:diaminopimelate decarboxylase
MSAMRSMPEWAGWTAQDWEVVASEHRTPLYVFDADFVRRRVRLVQDAFHGSAGVYYAVKANPNLGLLRAVRGDVDGVDISSGGELRQALSAGYAPEQMSFAGPAKTGDELRAAITAGVGCISTESLREIDACARIARELDRPAQILLRVNPAQVHRAYGLKMGGRALQFGIDESGLAAAEQRVLEHGPDLICRGLHTYVGSQCFDGAGTIEATATALRLAEGFEARTGWSCRKLNLGGGFGVAQSGERRELALDSMADGLRGLLRPFLESRPACQAFFELGRYVTAEAGIYVTRVIDAKSSRGTEFIVCDGGLNHQLAAAGTFGAALRGNFPVLNLSRPHAPSATCNIAGPSCNPTDLLGVQVSMPRAQPGDLIGVAMSGSYGLTASPLLFLGHDTPVELVLDRGSVVVGRSRHALEDFN